MTSFLLHDRVFDFLPRVTLSFPMKQGVTQAWRANRPCRLLGIQNATSQRVEVSLLLQGDVIPLGSHEGVWTPDMPLAIGDGVQLSGGVGWIHVDLGPDGPGRVRTYGTIGLWGIVDGGNHCLWTGPAHMAPAALRRYAGILEQALRGTGSEADGGDPAR